MIGRRMMSWTWRDHVMEICCYGVLVWSYIAPRVSGWRSPEYIALENGLPDPQGRGDFSQALRRYHGLTLAPSTRAAANIRASLSRKRP